MSDNIIMVAVGSVRLDKGEDIEYGYAAVERLRGKGITHYGFDVIYGDPSQKKRAKIYLSLMRKRIAERLPDVTLYSGITDNEMVREGAEKLLKYAHSIDSDGMGLMDINPGREKDWNDENK